MPDRIALTWSGNPARSIDVTWRTATSAAKPLVQITEAERLRGDIRSVASEACRSIEASREVFETDLGECYMNTCRVDDLEPAKMHAYRVGDGDYWSEWHQFKTAAEQPAPFRFVYFGDAQNDVRSLWSRVVREANQHAPRAAFMLHAGDLINRGNRDAEWGEWFEAGGWINGMIPIVATPGNHEYDGGLARHWRPQFSFPKNGPSGLEDTVYWFDYQGLARIISMNSNEKIAIQSGWLESVLDDPKRPKWTILTFHHPVYSAAKARDNFLLRKAWRSVIETNGVDLVLTGHDHAYARTPMGGPRNAPADQNVSTGERRRSANTVYVVSVSGPKQYTLQESWQVDRVASGVQLFQVVNVSKESIDYEARLATGELYDAFKLSKDADGTSKLEDTPVEVDPIRLR
ncbi:MAG: metallophosphoesterase family protein [Planctomycetota bacterium]